MNKRPIDLEAVRRAEQQFQAVLARYPELRQRNPERQAALQAWLATRDTEEQEGALQTHRTTDRQTEDERV